MINARSPCKLKARTSVGLERLLDLGTLGLLGVLALALIPETSAKGLHEALLVTAGVVLAGIAVLGWAFGARRPGSSKAGRGQGWSAWLALAIERTLKVLRELAWERGAPQRMLQAGALSLLGWGLFVVAMGACVAAAAPSTPSFAGLALTEVTNLGAAIPSSPAGLGVYHALGTMTLGALGVPVSQALAIAILSHALVVLTQIALGAGALAWSPAGSGGLGALREVRASGAETPAGRACERR